MMKIAARKPSAPIATVALVAILLIALTQSGCGGGASSGNGNVQNIKADVYPRLATKNVSFTLTCSGSAPSAMSGRCDIDQPWKPLTSEGTLTCNYTASGTYHPGCNTGPTTDTFLQGIHVFDGGNGSSSWMKSLKDDDALSMTMASTPNGNGVITAGIAPDADGVHRLHLARISLNGSISWEKFLDKGYEYTRIAKTASDDYMILSVNDYRTASLLISMDSSGNILWRKTRASGYIPSTIEATTDGGLMIAGAASTSSTPKKYIEKLDSSGNTIWEKTYFDSGASPVRDMVQTSSGDIVAIKSYATSAIMFRVPLDGSATSTIKTYTDPNFILLKKIVKNPVGGYYLCGSTESGFDYKPFIEKLDSSFNVIWHKAYSVDYVFNDLIALPDGKAIITGAVYKPNEDDKSAVFKIGLDGNIEWGAFAYFLKFAYSFLLLPSSDGGFFTLGETYEYDAYYPYERKSNYFLIKTDSNGNL